MPLILEIQTKAVIRKIFKKLHKMIYFKTQSINDYLITNPTKHMLPHAAHVFKPFTFLIFVTIVVLQCGLEEII